MAVHPGNTVSRNVMCSLWVSVTIRKCLWNLL